MPNAEQITQARKQTAGAIVALAESKFKLEAVRTDRDASAEKISDAASTHRQCEQTVKDMIDKEVAALIAYVKEQKLESMGAAIEQLAANTGQNPTETAETPGP